MKKVLSIIVVGLFMICQAGTAGAVSFSVGANVPLAASVAIQAFKVTCTNPNCTTSTTDVAASPSMDFAPLTFNATNNIYLSDHYYQITVVPAGAGALNTTVTYTEGTNPNSPGHGLGFKATAAFLKVVGNVETATAQTASNKLALKDIGVVGVTSTGLTGGYLKIYVGMETGGPSTNPSPATGSEVTTSLDKTGSYTGTLVVTATVS